MAEKRKRTNWQSTNDTTSKNFDMKKFVSILIYPISSQSHSKATCMFAHTKNTFGVTRTWSKMPVEKRRN